MIHISKGVYALAWTAIGRNPCREPTAPTSSLRRDLRAGLLLIASRLARGLGSSQTGCSAVFPDEAVE